MNKTTMNADNIKKATVKDLFEKFSSSEKGLSVSEAKERLQKYGYNEISEKKVSPLMKFLSYFWGPIPWMIEVAAIPVALPTVLTVTMAVGAMALARKKAIVSKLAAIEEMAGMDILCSDKTSTITKNKLTLAEVKPFAGFTVNDVLLFGLLASREEDQDPLFLSSTHLVRVRQKP